MRRKILSVISVGICVLTIEASAQAQSTGIRAFNLTTYGFFPPNSSPFPSTGPLAIYTPGTLPQGAYYFFRQGQNVSVTNWTFPIIEAQGRVVTTTAPDNIQSLRFTGLPAKINGKYIVGPFINANTLPASAAIASITETRGRPGFYYTESIGVFPPGYTYDYGWKWILIVPGLSRFDIASTDTPSYYNTSTGAWANFAGTCKSLYSYAAQTVSETRPAVGFFDNDILTDATYVNSRTGEWFSRSSSTGQSVNLGVFGSPSSDVPAVDDFDADGISDRTVFNGNGGQWKSIFSSLLYNSGLTVYNGAYHTLLSPNSRSGSLDVWYKSPGYPYTWNFLKSYDGLGTTGNPSGQMEPNGSGKIYLVAPDDAGNIRFFYGDIWNTLGYVNSFNGGQEILGNPSTLFNPSTGYFEVYVPVAGGIARFQKDFSNNWSLVEIFAANAAEDPSAFVDNNGTLNVVVKTSGGLSHYYRDSSGWHGYVFATGTVGRPSAIVDTYNSIQVFVTKPNGSLEFFYRDSTSPYSWHDAGAIAGSITGTPMLLENNVVVPGSSGGLINYYRTGAPNYSWLQGYTFAESTTGRGGSLGTLGQSGYRPIPADYDGDGKADLATYDSTNYYVRYSSNGQTRQYAPFFDSNGSEYLPSGFELPGDYDGDGKVDPATAYTTSDGSYTYYNVVYQSSVQGRALLNSFAAYTGSPIQSYLYPLSGDFDGDGKSDIAIFFPSANFIGYLSSLTGQPVSTANGCGYGGNSLVNFSNVGLNFTLSPIVVDTNGDGFSLTKAEDGVVFDLIGFGAAGKSSWTRAGSDDAFLTLDRNGNGTIDNGRELFGNHAAQPVNVSPNGFLALAEFDKLANGGNGDGSIDADDSVFSQLRLWLDRNHDGISQPEELLPVKSKGIARFALDYKASRRKDQYGNEFRYRARVYNERGASNGRWAWDVFFRMAPLGNGVELLPQSAGVMLNQPLLPR